MRDGNMERYIALIEEDNGNYGVVFPDLPGVVSAGISYEDAIKNAHEILAYVAQTQKLPKPHTLSELEKTWEDWTEWKENYDFVATPIQVLPISTKAKRINIMIDEALLARLDAVTSNRSEFIGKALEGILE
jgi:predicted RNase H-like HicB family nuclease